MKDIICKFCCADGVSGYEDAATKIFGEMASVYCEDIKKDALGNVIAMRRAENPDAKTVMIEAHADKIGLMVKHITDDGFILFSPIGGIDNKILPTLRVIIYGREKIRGVIGVVPPHVKKGDDKKVPKTEDLCIDTGMSAERVKEIVSVGDVIEFETDFTSLKGDMIAASACDDRAGLAVLIRVLELLKDEKLSVNVAAVAAVQEEVGLRGAGAATNSIEPQMAVCVDVCHGKTPDASDNVFDMGGGTVITVGPNVHPFMFKKLKEAAEKNKIDYQVDADGGDTGTDTWVVQTKNKGVMTALLSIPLRYMHTPYEVMSIADAESSARLIAEFLKDLKEGDFDNCCY